MVNDRFDEVRRIIIQYKMKLCASAGVAKLYMNDHEGFDRYFINLNIPNKREIRRNTIAVLDDGSEKDNDLLFTTHCDFARKKRAVENSTLIVAETET